MKMLATVSMKPQTALPGCLVFTAATTTLESGVLSRKAQDNYLTLYFPSYCDADPGKRTEVSPQEYLGAVVSQMLLKDECCLRPSSDCCCLLSILPVITQEWWPF